MARLCALCLLLLCCSDQLSARSRDGAARTKGKEKEEGDMTFVDAGIVFASGSLMSDCGSRCLGDRQQYLTPNWLFDINAKNGYWHQSIRRNALRKSLKTIPSWVVRTSASQQKEPWFGFRVYAAVVPAFVFRRPRSGGLYHPTSEERRGAP